MSAYQELTTLTCHRGEGHDSTLCDKNKKAGWDYKLLKYDTFLVPICFLPLSVLWNVYSWPLAPFPFAPFVNTWLHKKKTKIQMTAAFTMES